MSYKRPELANPQFISTSLVQEIVAVLKNPPFNENMTLLAFDEKREYELLELIVKAMSMIDQELAVDKSDTNEIFKVLLDFLKVINFPYSNERQLQEDLVRGEKRLLTQILHFFLTKMSDLKKRYYLSKYTSSIIVSDEFAGDDELIEYMNKYRELQAQFQSVYEMIEEKRQLNPQIKEIKDDIQKLQSDKLQLTQSISKFKKEYSTKKDFIELFDATSKLRKEQEEDSNLEKRLAKQQYDLEETEERLIIAKQRLAYNNRNLSDNISAFELLESLRNQRNANRDAFENLAKYELVDKRNKLKSLEEILRMPEISFDDVAQLKKEKVSLTTDLEKMEVKVRNSASKSSELQIYSQNALQATSAKENSIRLLEKIEREINLHDKKYEELERKFEQMKGYKFVKKDDILSQAEIVKKKKEVYVKYNKILDMIKGEALILNRTINVLKEKTSDGDDIVKKYEEKHGGALNQAKKELEELSRAKQEIDHSKRLTLEEYSKLIQQMTARLREQETKMKLAPLAEERERLKREYEQIQPVYQQRKKQFENAVSDLQSGYNKAKDEFNKNEAVFRECQNRYHQLNQSMKINEEMIRRCELEVQYTTRNDKKLNDKFKSYSEYYKEILSNQDAYLKTLKENQKNIKDAYEDNGRQIILYNDLKKILLVKLDTLKGKK